MRPVLLGILMFGIAAISTRAVFAQESDIVSTLPVDLVASKAPYTLTFDHISRTSTLQDQTGEILETWPTDVVPVASLPADRPLLFVVTYANTLLYSYTLSADVVRTVDLHSCSSPGMFSDSQGFLETILTAGGSGMGLMDVLPMALSGTSIRFELDELSSRSGDDDKEVSPLTLRRTLDNIESAVTEYAGDMETIATLPERLRARLAGVAARAEIEPIDPLLEAVQSSVERVLPGLSNPVAVPALISELHEQASAQLTSLEFMHSAVENHLYTGSADDAAVSTLESLRSRVVTAQDSVSSALPRLQSILHEIQNARDRSEIRFVINPSGPTVRQLGLSLDATESYADVMRLRTSTVRLYTRPGVRLTCRLAFGVARMDKPSRYESPDGEIINSAANETRVGAGLFLNVSHASIPLVGALLGIGLGDGSSPDLYAGGSLRLLDPIFVNFGAVWQRKPRLNNGLGIGDAVPDPIDNGALKTRYSPDLFIGISLAR